ncbi:helix-turn-helix domain-containing protein [Candidatus Omnitrophota bacterium]
MKLYEREKAIKLRKQGLTYSEIGQRLKVSKGSLSLWLRKISYVPTEQTLQRIRMASIRNGQILHSRKIRRITQAKTAAKQEMTRINAKELKLLGAMAYWTEGSKTKDHLVQFTNSDPKMIKFVLRWLRETCHVHEDKFRVHLRVHPDTDRKKLESYWSAVTSIPLTQFHKTTTKISGSNGRRHNKLNYGIAKITVCDTNLFYRIAGWIEGLVENSKL